MRKNMDELALSELPRLYRVGLKMRDLGATDELIADCLDMESGSVAILLEIGARKLQQAKIDLASREHNARQPRHPLTGQPISR
jgi:hypothetical protein